MNKHIETLEKIVMDTEESIQKLNDFIREATYNRGELISFVDEIKEELKQIKGE